MIQLAENIQTLAQQRKPFVLVTLTQIRGSAPQIEGAKMLVTQDGRFWGTVGGGKIEAHCVRHAQGLLVERSTSQAQTWNLQSDIHMSCGGEVTLFFDVSAEHRWPIAIFGAGHVAQELCRVLSTWSCQMSVFDTRAEWLEKLPASPNLERYLCEDMSAKVPDLPSGGFLLCMTQGHASDVPILSTALKHPERFAMIGVIGSAVKAAKIKLELTKLGLPASAVAKLVSPIGLPIGDNTPSEIAVSVAAQLLAIRDRKSFSVEDGLTGAWK